MSKKTNKLLLFLAPFLLTILIFITLSSLFIPKTKEEKLISPGVTTEQVATFSAEIAPSLSAKGAITSLFGDVFWQSRVATDSAKITKPQDIQQGETLKTGDNGSLNINFQNQAKLNILPKSEMSIVQTLPADFVFNQTDGTIEYIRTGNSPLTIRALHLLVDTSVGNITITVDHDQKTVGLVVKQGSATVAFNDTDLISQEASVSAGQEYDFDDQARTGTLAKF